MVIATRMLVILSFVFGASVFAAPSPGVLRYSGRLFDVSGEPFVGNILVRAEISASTCVLYRRVYQVSDGDAVTTDVDGNFQVAIQTGANSVNGSEYEAAGLQSILSTSQITPLTCAGGAMFTPSSSPERDVEIAISPDGGITWEAVDVQELLPYHQSFDSTLFAGQPIADFVRDPGDGSVTQAKVFNLLNSTYSSALTSLVTDGSLSLSNLTVTSNGSSPTSVVNKSYADSKLAGHAATSLGTLSVGDANKVIAWDGSQWVAQNAVSDPTKLSVTGGTIGGALYIDGAGSDLILRDQADLVMGSFGFIYLARHSTTPVLPTAAYAGAFWADANTNELNYFTGSGTLSILTSASTLNIAQSFSGTLGVNRGGTGTGSLTSNALLMANSTGSAMQSATCPTGYFLLSALSGWGCQPYTSGGAGELQFQSAGTMGANANLVFDSTNQKLGIGLSAPDSALHVAGSTGVTFDAYNGGTSLLSLRTSPGATLASSANTASGKTIGEIQFIGHRAAVFSPPSSVISAEATQNWSLSASGARMLFYTTPNSTIAAKPWMTLGQNGYLALTDGTDFTPDTRLFVKGAISAGPFAGSAGEMRFYEASANGGNHTALRAPASLTSDVLFTLPANDGSAGQMMVTDGSGSLSFANSISNSVGGDGDLQVASNGTLGVITGLHWRAGYGLGVGTAAAEATLHVAGGGIPVVITDSDMPSTGIHIQMKQGNGDVVGHIGASPADLFVASDTLGNAKFIVTQGGDVGLGAAPTEKLDLNGGNISMGYEHVTDTCTNISSGTNCVATCSPGKYVTGGGCDVLSPNGILNTSRPDGNNKWLCYHGSAVNDTVTVYAICMNVR